MTAPSTARPSAPDRRLPLGLVAVAALVGGIALLARPRPGPPQRPATPAARSTSPLPELPDPVAGPSATVRELDVERLHRRTA